MFLSFILRSGSVWGIILLILMAGCVQNIKEPSFAGRFYPSDSARLQETVSALLADAQGQKFEGRLIALIAPHAGYEYSGHTASAALSRLKDRPIDTVIIIGASHRRSFSGAAVYAAGGMRTPLGEIRINETLAKSFVDINSGVKEDPSAFEKEHVIEVLLPFIQGVNKDMTIVPIITGSMSKETFGMLSKKISDILGMQDRTIVVASTDLSHYHDYNSALAMDHRIIDAIERMSIDDLELHLTAGDAEMCGRYPVLLAMKAAIMQGANSGVLYEYRNSGDVKADRKDNVVGYGALGLYKKALDKQEREDLLSLARKTVEAYVNHGSAEDLESGDPRLNSHARTFVTLTRNGLLRGCIGNVKDRMPLYKSVIINSIAASSKDHRFPPVKKEELDELQVEVSVLSDFERVTDFQEVVIGTHGLYLVKGRNTSIILPQVADESGWDIHVFLEKLSLKAGLSAEGWKDALIYRFTAEVIR